MKIRLATAAGVTAAVTAEAAVPGRCDYRDTADASDGVDRRATAQVPGDHLGHRVLTDVARREHMPIRRSGQTRARSTPSASWPADRRQRSTHHSDTDTAAAPDRRSPPSSWRLRWEPS